MYAVIASGGKQHRVALGQTVHLEKLSAQVGDQIEFSEVLLVADDGNYYVGSPLVEGAHVSAEVVDQARAKKIEVIKFKRRKHHMKHMGHRQYYTAVKITGINLDSSNNQSNSED